MGFKIGYNNTESDSKFYCRYQYNKYYILLSKLTKQSNIKKPLVLDFHITKSATELKYGLNFRHFFYYNFFDKNLWTFNLDLSTKKKMIKFVNFDILPIIKLSASNTDIPLTLSLKHGKYQGSREQIFENYDYSQVLKSMLPYHRTGLNLSHMRYYDFNFLNRDVLFIHKYKLGYNCIHNYEDNLKTSISFKTLFDIKEFKFFTLGLSNEIVIKNSFINPISKYKSSQVNDKDFNPHHITSFFECRSKILGFNILNDDKTIDNGVKFYIRNNTIVKLKDIYLIKQNDLFNRLNPYMGIETLFYPIKKENGHNNNIPSLDWKNSFKFVFTAGLSIQVNNYMSVDLSFYTWAKNTPKLNKNMLNKFRVNMEISTNIE
jgi:hypothetical protein